MGCTTVLNPTETGIDVIIPIFFTISAGEEGKTGLVNTDVTWTLVDPDGNVSNPSVTLTEVDSGGAPGAYFVTIDADVFTAATTPIGIFQLFAQIETGGAADATHCAYTVEIVNKQWARFGPDFDSLFRRVTDFLQREGVAP